MRDLTTILAGALGGAVISLVVVYSAAQSGLLPAAPVSGDSIRTYLLDHPEIVDQMAQKLADQQQAIQDRMTAATLKQIGTAAFFDPKIAFVTGPADAKKSVVEFYDYNCPYCRASMPTVEKFYQQHKNDTRFSFIEYPIKGPDSIVAAKVALAARNQPDKYLALHFALMSEMQPVDANIIMQDAVKAGLDIEKLKSDMQKPEIQAAIDQSHELAEKAGAQGTPTFIINGVMHPGAVDDELINSLAAQS